MDPSSPPTAFPLGGWLWNVLMVSPSVQRLVGCCSGAAPCCGCADLPGLYPLRPAMTAASFCADANPMNDLSARVAGGVFPDGVRAKDAKWVALFFLRDLDRAIPAGRGRLTVLMRQLPGRPAGRFGSSSPTTISGSGTEVDAKQKHQRRHAEARLLPPNRRRARSPGPRTQSPATG